MKLKNLFPIALLGIIFTLIFVMCIKTSDAPPSHNNAGYQTSTSERGEMDFTTLVIDMAANDGNCYRVTLNRQADNSVTFSKTQITCTDSCIATNVFATNLIEPSNGKIFINNLTTWYIPLLGGEIVCRTTGYYECFCEGSCLDPNYSSECILYSSGGGYGCGSMCCTDCDMIYCDDPGMPHRDEQGIYVLASYITSN